MQLTDQEHRAVKLAKESKWKNKHICQMIGFMRGKKRSRPAPSTIFRAERRPLRKHKVTIAPSASALAILKHVGKLQGDHRASLEGVSQTNLAKKFGITRQRVGQILKPWGIFRKAKNFKPLDEASRAQRKAVAANHLKILGEDRLVIFVDEKKYERIAEAKDKDKLSTKGSGNVFVASAAAEDTLTSHLGEDLVENLKHPPTKLKPKTAIGIPGVNVTASMTFYKGKGSFSSWDFGPNSGPLFLKRMLKLVKKQRAKFGISPTAKKQTVLVMDGAKYHTSRKVLETLQDNSVTVLVLPPFSPDLMPLDWTGWRLVAQQATSQSLSSRRVGEKRSAFNRRKVKEWKKR